VILAVTGWAIVLAVWFILAQFKVLPPLSLPHPAGVLAALARLWTDYNLPETWP